MKEEKRMRETERATLSPLLSGLLIPVILFDGIRFINNQKRNEERKKEKKEKACGGS